MRPCDLHQRDGRILRQGNAYAEVEIYRYVTEGSFDGYSWQTVARKSAFLDQVMHGRLDVREIEDIGEATLGFDVIWTERGPQLVRENGCVPSVAPYRPTGSRGGVPRRAPGAEAFTAT